MILRALSLLILFGASLYLTVMQGVRRFMALTEAPESLKPDLQFWGFVYLSAGALLFTAACTLAFYWLARKLHSIKH